MDFVTWKNNKIFYRDTNPNNGHPTILCIHGAGGNSRHWAALLAAAKDQGYRIMAVDLPGHGRSEGNPMDSIKSYSLFIEEFLGIIGIQHFVLGGHSMGGAIALDLALRNKITPEALILMGTVAKFKVGDWLINSLKEGIIPPNFIKLAYHGNASPALINLAQKEGLAVHVSVYLKDFQACQAFDVTKKIAELNIPSLVIFGADDRLTPVKGGEALSKSLPNSQLKTIPETGHMVMIEKPQEVYYLISQFLNNRPR